jgi:hypothetical protein
MEMEFSRIEAYLNDELNMPEKEQFEKDVALNKQLAERLDFYKNLQIHHTPDLKPIEFEKRILPDINNINFTEKKESSVSKNGLIAGIVTVLILVSTIFLINNRLINNKLTAYQFQNDSLKSVSQELEKKFANISGQQFSADNNTFSPNNETINSLNQKIKDKEEEIALLKSGNTSDQNKALVKEVDDLKKELAKVKQEYFENSGQFASDIKVDDVIKSIRFINSGGNLKINWKSTNKYKVEMYNTDEILMTSSGELVVNEWIVKNPGDGFYILRFIPVKGEQVKLLLELKKYPKIWLPD